MTVTITPVVSSLFLFPVFENGNVDYTAKPTPIEKPQFEVNIVGTNESTRVDTIEEANAVKTQWEGREAKKAQAEDVIRRAWDMRETEPVESAPVRKYLSGPVCVSCGCAADIPTPFGTQCMDCLSTGEL